MAHVYVDGETCKSEHCQLARVPVAGETIELSDGTLVQILSVTHTPHRQGLDAVASAGKIEGKERCRAEADRITSATAGRTQIG